MKFVKAEGRVNAVDANGRVIAYIEKNRFGTHGHSRGYKHYVFSPQKNDYLWAGIDRRIVSVDFAEAPGFFSNISQFKAFYE